MNKTITFTIIKPDAYAEGNAGAIITHITGAGFRFKAMKLVHLSIADAEHFYDIHAEMLFFDDLITFMSSGPCIVAVLEKENAVASFRELIGATDPSKATQGTIRQLYAESIGRNAIHGSDTDENALKESHFFFAARDFM